MTIARRQGIQFSALERALDELNYARNSMIHGGALPSLEWNVVTLAFLGARFWIALFKRLLSWEGVRPWDEADECDVVGLQALAIHGRTSLEEGYTAYRRAVDDCQRETLDRRVREHLNRLLGPETGEAPGSSEAPPG